MGITLGALHFDAVHAVAEVIQAGDGFTADRLKVAGPAATGIEFGIRIKQLGLTAGAVINARYFAVVVLASKSALGAAQLGLRGFTSLAATGEVQEHTPGAVAALTRAFATGCAPIGGLGF